MTSADYAARMWTLRTEAAMPPRRTHVSVLTPDLMRRSLLINERRRFVYRQVPKAACSTVVLRLWSALFACGSTDLRPDRSRLHDLSLPFWSANYLSVRREDFFQFAFFRNPFVRTLSAYLNKLALVRPNPNRAQLYGLAGLDLDRSLGFSEFLEILEDRALLMSDRHWMPQTDVSVFDYIPIDYAGRVEDSEDGMAKVASHIFGDGVHAKLDHLAHQTKAVERVCEYYKAADIARVLKLYERDFELLGYSTSPSDAAPTGPVMIEAAGRFSGNARFLEKLTAASSRLTGSASCQS